ncbi:hypothetical protein [Paraburkholderia sp. RL17-381-BIF-C]|jgi:hypothetical protein|uniref:hypothetical protein n=1 Tax=Paraburkholderia sp. RL17-381-BIF-C TaxID=3031635 RepID=UPI0038BCAACC
MSRLPSLLALPEMNGRAGGLVDALQSLGGVRRGVESRVVAIESGCLCTCASLRQLGRFTQDIDVSMRADVLIRAA